MHWFGVLVNWNNSPLCCDEEEVGWLAPISHICSDFKLRFEVSIHISQSPHVSESDLYLNRLHTSVRRGGGVFKYGKQTEKRAPWETGLSPLHTHPHTQRHTHAHAHWVTTLRVFRHRDLLYPHNSINSLWALISLICFSLLYPSLVCLSACLHIRPSVSPLKWKVLFWCHLI